MPGPYLVIRELIYNINIFLYPYDRYILKIKFIIVEVSSTPPLFRIMEELS